MNIYENGVTKLYLNLGPNFSSQQNIKQHNYLLAKIGEIEAYFSSKITKKEKLAKTIKCLATVLNAFSS